MLTKEQRELEKLETSTLQQIEFLTKYPDFILDEYNNGKIRIDGMKHLIQRSVSLKAEAEVELARIRSLSSEVYLRQEAARRRRSED